MKFARLIPALLVALLLLCTSAIAQDVHTDFDRNVNFERFHTYSWSRVETDNPLWQPRIKEAIDKELEAKGWQQVPSGGDVLLTAVGAVHNQREYTTFYNGMPGGWWWGGWGARTATTTVENQPVGTLVLDMYDAGNHRLIWRGMAADTLSEKPEKNENKLQKTATKMFKDFPPKPKEKKS